MYRFLSLLFFIFCLTACVSTKVVQDQRPLHWSQVLPDVELKNFYKVDDSLYRSAQPSSKEMKALNDYGIKTVLNLRLYWSDKQEGKHTNLVLLHQPLNTNKVSYDDIVYCMKTIQQAKKPLLIHCLHGSDRTGCMVAVYRMLYNGWTKEEAIKEFKAGGFGYHEKWFPNILALLKSVDVEKLKREVFLAESKQ